LLPIFIDVKSMKSIKSALTLLKNSAIAFSDDNAFKLSASLSYYTIFALGPLLIIVISLSGYFLGRDAVQGRVYEELNSVVGSEAALQIQDIIKSAHSTHATTLGTIVGLVILVIGATGVFTEMQSSINFIWSVKAKPKKGWLKYLGNRLLSFSLVVCLGFLLLVSLMVNTLLNLLMKGLANRFPKLDFDILNTANTIIILAVIASLFAVIYKVLPDAVISWKDAWIGSIFTAGLFMVGKFLIGLYIGRSNMGLTYGTAASVVIILTWVYYSSLILYFGAEFTKIYALHSGEGIRPKQTAVFILKRETKEVPMSRLDG
jgi:membrane protein